MSKALGYDPLFEPPKTPREILLCRGLALRGWRRIDSGRWPRIFVHPERKVRAFVTQDGKLVFGHTLRDGLRARGHVVREFLSAGLPAELTLEDLL